MNPTFSGIGNPQHARMKVVKYTGTDPIVEGMLVAYDHDTTVNPTGGDAIAEGGNNPGRYYYVEKLKAANVKAFAGVVAKGSYNGLKGPRTITIYVPNSAIVPVLVKADVSFGDAIYLVQAQYYASKAAVAGQQIGVAMEARNTDAAEDLILVALHGNVFPPAVTSVIGDVTGAEGAPLALASEAGQDLTATAGAGGDVVVTSSGLGDIDLVSGDDITLTAADDVVVTADNLTVTGDVGVTGDVAVTGDLSVDDVDVKSYGGDVTSTTPTAAELATILGAPATAGRVRIVVATGGTGSGEVYLCVDDGTNWTFSQLTVSTD